MHVKAPVVTIHGHGSVERQRYVLGLGDEEACIALAIDVDVDIQTGEAAGTQQAHVLRTAYGWGERGLDGCHGIVLVYTAGVVLVLVVGYIGASKAQLLWLVFRTSASVVEER